MKPAKQIISVFRAWSSLWVCISLLVAPVFHNPKLQSEYAIPVDPLPHLFTYWLVRSFVHSLTGHSWRACSDQVLGLSVIVN